MCKFGNKNVFLMLWHFCGFFSIFQFSAFTENGFLNFSQNRFRNEFLSYNTHYQTLSGCANSKS